MNTFKAVVPVVLSLLASSLAQAAVSPEEAAKLGASLTRVGAEMAANADGSIPAYSGGLTTAPAGFTPGDGIRPNPYAGEKPLFSITSKNMAQYQANLNVVAQEMLKRYPAFRMDVYPTHRSAVLPEANLQNTAQNALNARSIDGGLGIENALPGVPFPIPQTGAEAMWNHLLRYQGKTLAATTSSYVVDSAGNASLSATSEGWIDLPIYRNMSTVLSPTDIYYQIRVIYTAPARRAGEAILAQDAVNALTQPRKAWQYLPGQRRVKLAPELAYDTPNPEGGGTQNYDDAFVFLGALDRYDWTLVGKKELYIPYNAYDITYNPDPKSIVTPNFVNPDHLRWEKHRVWVVEANLKPGKRHVYARRTFYLDEDSWDAVASDQYDANGLIYRGSYAFPTQSYDANVPDTTPQVTYDLTNGIYSISSLPGAYDGIRYIEPLPSTDWSPASLALSGVR